MFVYNDCSSEVCNSLIFLFFVFLKNKVFFYFGFKCLKNFFCKWLFMINSLVVIFFFYEDLVSKLYK